MRRYGLAGLLVVVIGATATFATAAASAPSPRKPIARYCSQTGDICFAVVNRGGAVYFELRTAARYFLRYRLCVRPPNRARGCRGFPMRPAGALWTSTVRFAKNYPYAGPGVYRATWIQSGIALGPTLRFRLPLAR